MARPQPITLTQIDANNYTGYTPKPVVVVGPIPGTDPEIDPQPAPAINPAPADADAVAADLQSVVDALVAAGVFTVTAP